MTIEAVDTGAEIRLLHEKVDRLTGLLEAQERRYQELEELKQDMIPIVNHAIKLSIDELAEVGTEFKLEDLIYLLKRLLRSTDMLNRMLDQLEAVSALQDEADILGRQVFSSVVEKLDHLEREGYFAFARNGMYVVEQVVSEFDEEDVRALGDNIVLILRTIRNMTQPEIMSMANNAVNAIRDEDPNGDKISTWSLIKEFGDPKVRKGLTRLLNLVKALADQPAQPKDS